MTPEEAAKTKFEYTQKTLGAKRAAALEGSQEAALLPELEGQYGRGFPMKSFQPSAGLIIKPPPGESTLEVVAWNTGNKVPRHNLSHAEKQFISWFNNRPPEWKKRVVSIAFHLTHNPCAKGETGCAFDIVDLQAALSPQKAVVTVTWDEDRADMAKAKKTLGPIAK